MTDLTPEPDRPEPGPVDRAAAFVAAGLERTLPRGAPATLEAAAREDPDPRVRAAALGALVRAAGRRRAASAWQAAAADLHVAVRRRTAELAPALGATASVRTLLALLADDEVTVAEAAAWALGEVVWAPRARGAAVRGLVGAARHHDALVREAAVAALGALGDRRGLDAVLAACTDRPAVRRRAVLALAPFDGSEVEAALTRALDDPDWQVRQAAEDLTR